MSAAPFPNPLPPLTQESESDLRASIVKHGVLIPAVEDQHGRVLDGNHRKRLAGALGVEMPPPVVVHSRDDDHAREVAVELNVARRHLNIEDRRRLVAGLRADGKSTRAIAATVGVNHSTVVRDLSRGADAPPERVAGEDGKTYPAAKPVKTLKNPATDPQLKYLAKLCRKHGEDMPDMPISKAKARKLIDRLKNGPPPLAAGPFVAKLQKLVADAEDAVPLGPEFEPALALAVRLVQALNVGAVNGFTPDELQALVDAGG
jgi:ParB-like chromosome segregation protein Spo0J